MKSSRIQEWTQKNSAKLQIVGMVLVWMTILLIPTPPPHPKSSMEEVPVERYVVAGGIVRNRDWVIERSVEGIRNQTIPPDLLYYITGDNHDSTQDLLLQMHILHDVINTGYPGYERTGPVRYSSENMGHLRRKWLDRHRDRASHYWIVDSDIIPKPDVLERLLSLDSPCAGAFIPGCTPMEGWDTELNRPSRTGREGTHDSPFNGTCMGGCYLLRKDFLDGVGWEPWGAHPQGEDGYLATLAHDGGWEIRIDPFATGQHIMRRDR